MFVELDDWKVKKIEKEEITTKAMIIVVVAIARARCTPLEVPFKVTVSLPYGIFEL
jgi:hypothetical protein